MPRITATNPVGMYHASVCNFQSMKFFCNQNSFVISPGLLYHLIRGNTGRLANEAFASNPIVSSKQ